MWHESSIQLLRRDNGDVVIEVLHIANTIWTRFVGLQFKRALPTGHALLIVPCSSIHTIRVRFAIDVFFLSDQGEVTEVHRDVRPWRFALPSRKAFAVLETTAGEIDLEEGTQVVMNGFADSEAKSLPQCLLPVQGDEE